MQPMKVTIVGPLTQFKHEMYDMANKLATEALKLELQGRFPQFDSNFAFGTNYVVDTTSAGVVKMGRVNMEKGAMVELLEVHYPAPLEDGRYPVADVVGTVFDADVVVTLSECDPNDILSYPAEMAEAIVHNLALGEEHVKPCFNLYRDSYDYASQDDFRKFLIENIGYQIEQTNVTEEQPQEPTE